MNQDSSDVRPAAFLRTVLDGLAIVVAPPVLFYALYYVYFQGLPGLGISAERLFAVSVFPYDGVFVERPLRAFAVSILLLVIFWPAMRQRRRDHRLLLPLALPASAWTWYAMAELSLVGKGYNIRIDLIVTYPILTVTTLVGFVYMAGSVPKLLRLWKAKGGKPTPVGGG